MVAATKPAAEPENRGRLKGSPLSFLENTAGEDDLDLEAHKRFHEDLLYQCTFTVGGFLLELLEEARDLTSHSIPCGNTEQIMVRAMQLIIATVKKTRFALQCFDPWAEPCGETGQAEANSPREDSPREDAPREDAQTVEPVLPEDSPREDSPREEPSLYETIDSQGRHLPAEVRRTVFFRDGGKCAFISVDGELCESKFQMEFHHMVAFGRGGSHKINNTEPRCRNRDHLASILEYGQDVAELFAAKRAAAFAMAKAKTETEPGPDDSSG